MPKIKCLAKGLLLFIASHFSGQAIAVRQIQNHEILNHLRQRESDLLGNRAPPTSRDQQPWILTRLLRKLLQATLATRFGIAQAALASD